MSTGKTPFELVYGDNVTLLVDLVFDSPVQVQSAGKVARRAAQSVKEGTE